jgi:hypothetical protein
LESVGHGSHPGTKKIMFWCLMIIGIKLNLSIFDPQGISRIIIGRLVSQLLLGLGHKGSHGRSGTESLRLRQSRELSVKFKKNDDFFNKINTYFLN